MSAMMGYSGKGDWDFRGADTKEYTHCFHIYPAMMIPQIARKLIHEYGKKGGLLFDPYCGTGTSLVEARLFGMDAAGTDLNPTARMIAVAKSRDYMIHELEENVETYLEGLEGELAETDSYDAFDAPETVSFESLETWFPVATIGEICHCIHRISEIEEESSRAFIRIALSECLRLVSFQRNGEFKLYRIPENQRHEHYVPLYPLLEDRILRNLEGCKSFNESVTLGTTASVYSFNTVETTGGEEMREKPDLVVTSPPYGDSATTVAYAQFSWLTNVWLGLEGSPAGALDRELMGGRRKEIEEFGFTPMDEAISRIVEQDPKRATEIMHFYSEYRKSISNVASEMKEGGYSCYVVGNRIVKGIQLPTDLFTAWSFEQYGFTHKTTYIREIPNKRMPSRNSPSNVTGQTSSTMTNEYIVVCRKKKQLEWWKLLIGIGIGIVFLII